MSELIDITELEQRREVAIMAAEALAEEVGKIQDLTKGCISGELVMQIVGRLAPNKVIRAQEQIVAMECRENASVLREMNLCGEGTLYYDVFKEIDCVMSGYAAHIEHVFGQALANISSDSSKAGDLYRDIARVVSLSRMYDNPQEIRINDWDDVIPVGEEYGDYLSDITPGETLKNALKEYLNWSKVAVGYIWSVDNALKNVKERMHALQILHKRAHSYIPEVPGE